MIENSTRLSLFAEELRKTPIGWSILDVSTVKRIHCEDKPVFMHIGSYGNTMSRNNALETFTHGPVCNILNRYFIPVAADMEDNPEVLLLACDILKMNGTAQSPGMSIFFLPDMRPFAAIPECGKEEMLSFLENVVFLYINKRNALEEAASALTAALMKTGIIIKKEPPQNISFSLLKRYTDGWKSFFRNYKGYFDDLKPFGLRAGALLYLIEYFKSTNDRDTIDFVRYIMDNVLYSPMYDPIEGGFFNRSEDFSCKYPLFEKSILDNMMYARVLYELYKVTGKEEYHAFSIKTRDFIIEELSTGDGFFINGTTLSGYDRYNSYYHISMEELREEFGKDWKSVAETLCMKTDIGNNIPQLPRNSRKSVTMCKDTLKRLKKIRKTHDGLIRDNRISTTYNCIMAMFMPDMPESAEKILRHIDMQFHDEKTGYSLFRYMNTRNPYYAGDLSDYINLLRAFISLYRNSPDRFGGYLDKAEKLCGDIIGNFYCRENGMFKKSRISCEKQIPVLGRESNTDGIRPSANSIMCSALISLFEITGKIKYYDTAIQMIYNIMPHLDGTGPLMANWARQILRLLSFPEKNGTVTIA